MAEPEATGSSSRADEDVEDVAFDVVRSANLPRLICDTINVEVMPNGVELSLITRSHVPSGVEWPADHSQPVRLHMNSEIEEVARIRMSPVTANDLAMNLILELAQSMGVSMEALETNFDVIRKRVEDFRLSDGDD